MKFEQDVKYLKGVGPKMLEELNKAGIMSVIDLLLYFPRDYENFATQKVFRELEIGEKAVIECEVEEIKRDVRTKGGKLITTIVFNDGDSSFKGVWFNQQYVKKSFVIGNTYFLQGSKKEFGSAKTFSNPKIIRNTTIDEKSIIPKYPLRGKLTNTFLNKIISQVIGEVNIKENMPMHIIEKYGFCSLKDAIYNIHSPRGKVELDRAIERLKFQELFTYSLKILSLKEYVKGARDGIEYKMDPELVSLRESLPFELTNAQRRVVREILKDEKTPVPMNRLVQGDVGSGKTIVAIIAMFNVVKNGYQAAMMAPTEILATQHFNEVQKILREFNINIELLVGSTTAKNKKIIKEKLSAGEIDILVGTHALIEEDVVFNKLGLAVTDEQHRFGVHQRSKISSKAEMADVLVMTATPIPRTLSLYLYGDLDISIIDELPPGRKKVLTQYISKEQKGKAYNFALKEIKDGRQVYVVCPLIEENEDLKLTSVEKLYEELKSTHFKDVSVEILHGKMKPKEKDEIMKRFKAGEIKVLISTTVIEVGVNVPNASIMIIENAERFGLAQIHQLRGRVGRGQYQSHCILIPEIKSDVTRKRMEIVCASNDGFYIAEEDMKLRGTGEMFGVRQSGDTELILADIVEDIVLLKKANEEAKKVLSSESLDDLVIKRDILQRLEKSENYICYN